MAQTDPAKVELALQLAAINSGNASLTAKQLREQAGINLKPATITGWMRGRYAKRYNELFELHAEQSRRVAAEAAASIAGRSAEVTAMMVEAAAESIPELDPRDRAPSARAMSQVHAAMTEKSLLLQGEATQKVSITELPEILNELKALNVIDSDAEEITDSQAIDVAELEAAST